MKKEECRMKKRKEPGCDSNSCGPHSARVKFETSEPSFRVLRSSFCVFRSAFGIPPEPPMIRPYHCFAALVALFVASTAARAAEPLLQSGDYLAVVGDSITEQKL